MQKLGVNEIRRKYLEFFESKGHYKMDSASLVPQNDKSLLLINSGMAPLKPFFTGQQIPPSKRVTTCQKCIRTGDIENVGKTARHGTFFEMLGNFSFGDYFKVEATAWAWEFMTKVMEIPAERLYVSIYEEDDEAFDIWTKGVGLPEEKIFRMGKEDNFWEHGVGPCGPCSEIYYDRGEKYGCGSPDCTVGCDCDRYMEVWNLVFTQFDKQEDGSYPRLEHPNIDTGMGLERLATVMQDVDSIFDVDTVKAVRDAVCKKADVEYLQDSKKDVSIRVITDHIRSVTFMTSDGVLPSNEGRGYVLRRLLRRAARHGKLLGIEDKFLAELSKIVIETSKDAYPQLEEKKEMILKILTVEEERFYETINLGMEILKNDIEKMKKDGRHTLDGEKSFKLYDTYGFPVELMQEILEEENFDLDMDSFKALMDNQRKKARDARGTDTYMGAEETVFHKIDPSLSSQFTGYTNNIDTGKVVALVVGDEIADSGKTGDNVFVITDKTPFYAESGGQSGDTGIIKNDNVIIEVTDTTKFGSNKIIHSGVVKSGEIKLNDTVTMEIDVDKRLATARNHTTTHLLQKALREVLGTHVEQAGSFVSSNRLRFDFTHFEAVSKEDLAKIEKIVNENILSAHNVVVKEMPIEEAKKLGAMALFGEKYGDTVRVVNINDYSIEFCGGTHLTNTAIAGSFKILSESGVAAGVRRIEGITGFSVFNYYEEEQLVLNGIGDILKVTSKNIMDKVSSLIEENKQLKKEIEFYKAKSVSGKIDEIINNKTEVNGVNIVSACLDNVDMNSLRDMGDKIKDKIKSGAILLLSSLNDKVNIIVMVTDDVIAKGIKAGEIVKTAATLCGGGGGGRDNMAQAGGKDVSKMSDALQAGVDLIKSKL